MLAGLHTGTVETGLSQGSGGPSGVNQLVDTGPRIHECQKMFLSFGSSMRGLLIDHCGVSSVGPGVDVGSPRPAKRYEATKASDAPRRGRRCVGRRKKS